MLNEKRTQRIMKSKFLIFLSAVAMLLLFSNCGSKTTSNDQYYRSERHCRFKRRSCTG